MRQSPPLMISRGDIEGQHSTVPGSPLPYVAALFLPALLTHPDAVILLAGPSPLAGTARDRLAHFLAVPSHKIHIVPLSAPQYTNQIAAIIDYFPEPALFALPKSSVVEFDTNLQKFKVDFEVSPDGAYVEEVKAQWAPLKFNILAQAPLAAVGVPIKVGTKIVSVFAFDRVTAVNVENSVKNKIEFALKVGEPSLQQVGVDFYGAAGMKLQDGATKPLFEFGVRLTVPFDLF